MADKVLTDDAVVKMLQDEARSASSNFESQGLGAYLPRRSTGQAPRANTRFLRNILRETDSHNQALLAKEAEEAQARLRALKRKEERQRRDDEQENRRSRRDRGHEEERYRSKRRRVDKVDRDNNRLSPPKESHRCVEEKPSHRRRSRDRERMRHRSRSRSTSRHRRRRGRDDDSDSGECYEHRKQRSKKHRPRDGDRIDDEQYHRRRPKEPCSYGRRRSRSVSSDGVDNEDRHHRRRSSRDGRRRGAHYSDDEARHRSRDKRKRRRSPSQLPATASDSDHHHNKSCRRKWPRSPSANSERSTSRTPARWRDRDASHSKHENSNEHKKKHLPFSPPNPTVNGSALKSYDSVDSDPLEDIVGPIPLPPPPKVRVRGRGAVSGSAGMDSRFSSNYDPSTDVAVDLEDDDDWGQALEALQARAKFKQNQGDRLRAAGFTEDEIKTWEKGGEKNENDVRWAKLGEGREWDRGKVLDDEGKVQVDMDFGRLK